MLDFEEIFTVLLGFACVLTVITVLGHGLWLAIAGLFKLLSREAPHSSAEDCSICGGIGTVRSGLCDHCGAIPQQRPAAGEAGDIAAAQRQLRRLVERGALPLELHNQITRAFVDPSATVSPFPQAADLKQPSPEQPPPAVSDSVPPSDEHVITAEAVEEDASSLAKVPPVQGEWPAGWQESHDRSSPVVAATDQTHPLDRPETATPAAHRRPAMKILLQTFMEQKNIRWGEIISGLLIVVCAVGLVISLWATLRDSIPYLPALIFLAGTAALHAAGHYTLRRWQLRSISRAVLMIATLLIPLNFLAGVALSPRGESATAFPIFLLACFVGLAAYGAMAWFAGGALLRESRGWFVLAVIGPSAGQLLLNRVMNPAQPWITSLLIAAPVLAYLMAVGGALQSVRRRRHLSPPRAQALLFVLGMGTFSIAGPIALFLSNSSSLESGLSQLAPAISLAGAAVLSIGLFVHQRTRVPRFAALRTSGTALSVAGTIMLLTAVAFAWPTPLLLFLVGVTNAVLISVLAFTTGVAALQVPAIACGAIAFLVGFHVVAGTYPSWWINSQLVVARSILTGQTGVALTFYGLIVFAAAAPLRLKQRAHSWVLLLSGIGVLAVSTLISVAVGFLAVPGSEVAPLILLLHGLAICSAGLFVADPRPAGIGAAVLYIATLQATAFNSLVRDTLQGWEAFAQQPLLMGTVTYSFFVALAVVAAARNLAWMDPDARLRTWWKGFVNPLSIASLLAGGLAGITLAVLLATGAQDLSFWRSGLCCGALSLSILLVGVSQIRPPLFLTFQCTATVSLSLLTAGSSESQASWEGVFSSGHLWTQIFALASWSFLWRLVTFSGRSTRFIRELVPHPRYTVDTFLAPTLVVALIAFCCLALRPGILFEFGFTDGVPDPASQSAGARPAYLPWVTLALLVATTSLLLLQEVTGLLIGVLAVMLSVVPLLLAERWGASGATATALRWYFAAYAAIGISLLAARGWISRDATWEKGRVAVQLREWLQLTTLVLVVGVGVVLGLTSWTVARVAGGHQLGGPIGGSFFHRMGPTWSYAVPMSLCVASLLVAAARERVSLFALAGSLVFQYLTSLAYLLPILSSGASLNFSSTAGLLQWNAVALGAYAFVWLLLRSKIDPSSPSSLDPDVRWQVWANQAVVALLAVWSAAAVIAYPDMIEDELRVLGRWPSYMALGLVSVATYAYYRSRFVIPQILSPLLIVLVPLIAASCSLRTGVQGRDCLHVLMVGWSIVALLQAIFAWRWHQDVWAGHVSLGLTAVVIPLAFQSGSVRPEGAFWSAACLVLLTISGCWLGVLHRLNRFAYASVIGAGCGANFVWCVLITSATPQAYLQLSQWVVATMGLVCLGWLLLEVRSQRLDDRPFMASSGALACYRVFPLLGLMATAFISFCCYWIAALARANNGTAPLDISQASGFVVAFVLMAIFLGLLWDRTARQGLLGLYLGGLVCLLVALDAFGFEILEATTGFSVGLAGYGALTGWIWRRGVNWSSWGIRHGVSDPVTGLRGAAGWLPLLNSLLTAAALLLGLLAVIAFPDRHLRFVAAFVPFLAALGIAALAQDQRRAAFRLLSLVLVTLGGVYLSWADIEPSFDATTWLDRVVRVLIVLCAVALVFSVLLTRRVSSVSAWVTPLRRASVLNGAGAMAMLVAVLLLEVPFYLDNPLQGAPLSDPQVAVVAIVLAGLVAALITLALLPDSKSWVNTDEARKRLVYAAQLVGGLLFVHLYLARPTWFSAELRQYWPYILMAIAFLGAGVGEIFRRAGVHVMGEPLQRTGAFLPLLPAIGIWFVASGSNQSVVFFAAGLLYLFLSLTRHSTSHLAAAVISGNASLWALLFQHELNIWGTPQFWLIPPAVSVLAAGELNRKRLQPELLSSIRYGSLLVIYVSSAGEMFLRGIGNQLWPPMVLLFLSLVGAFCGMVFRVRAFLFLGSTFAFLSLMSMVWHASRAIQHSWPWWAFGIGLGITILIFFGYFEKNRDRINQMVGEIRDW